MRLRHPMVILTLAAALSGAGCYTMLRHPEVQDLATEEGDRKSCADCHSDAEFYHDVTYGDASWYSTYPEPWAAYYEYPWWYDDYWYVAPPDGGTISVDASGRHVWTRESSGPGFLPVQGGQNEGGNSKPTTTDKPDKPKDKEKDKKDKEKRHIWSR
jgi:hypothetical protein